MRDVAAAVGDMMQREIAALRNWRTNAEAKLAARLRLSLGAPADVSDGEVLGRVDAFFTCRSCRDSMLAPAAVRHCCVDGSIDEMAANWPLDASTNPLDLMQPISGAGLQRIQRMLRALGHSEDASMADVGYGHYVVLPSFRPELSGQDHIELSGVSPGFDDLVRTLPRGSR